MNYKKRLNTIITKIGERTEIEGIDQIYRGNELFFSIKANGLEIYRGCDGKMFKIEFHCYSDDWTDSEDLTNKIEKWFDYVEEQVEKEINVPSIISINGRHYKLMSNLNK